MPQSLNSFFSRAHHQELKVPAPGNPEHSRRRLQLKSVHLVSCRFAIATRDTLFREDQVQQQQEPGHTSSGPYQTQVPSPCSTSSPQSGRRHQGRKERRWLTSVSKLLPCLLLQATCYALASHAFTRILHHPTADICPAERPVMQEVQEKALWRRQRLYSDYLAETLGLETPFGEGVLPPSMLCLSGVMLHNCNQLRLFTLGP
jgi:hypothetical protein